MNLPASQDYPRWMFHRVEPPVIVQTEAEEAALGAEWSRIIQPREEPAPLPSAPAPEPPEALRKRPPRRQA